MDELLQQFQIEAPELVQRAVDDLLALERDGADRARLDGVFRAVHTLKGSVALFDLAPLGAALHAAEDWLGEVRAGGGPLSGDRLDVLLDLLGRSEAWVRDLQPDSPMSPGAAATCHALAARLKGLDVETAREPPPHAASKTPDWAQAMLDAHLHLAHGPPKLLLRYTPDPECFFRGEDPLAQLAGVPDLLDLDATPRAPWPEPELYDPFRCNLVFTAATEASAEKVRAALRLAGGEVELHVPAASGPAEDMAQAKGAAADRLLRVDPARIDALLDLADDLLAANAALADVELEGAAGRRLSLRRQQLDRIAAELHTAVLRVRLAPLSRTFERLPRLARELSARLGKPARLEVSGGAVEADRMVVDALFEPLLHLVRNALDHGVEPPAGRLAAGKPAEACLRLTAYAEGGELRVEVGDDGAGVDVEAVKARAVAQGLLTVKAAAALDEAQALQLLFASGFSTAARVSEVSGRGVGLDAVKRGLEEVGGRVVLASSAGHGATVTLSAPISAVLTRMLLLQVGEEVYAAPLAAVREIARLPREQVTAVSDGEAFVWRDKTAPLLSLHERLNMARPARGADMLRLVMVDGGEGLVALEVDGLPGRISGVVRPLRGLLAGMPGVLGTTLKGDGEVLFVLDLEALVR